jgi:3,4-dihydroxy 2-butanone 4-phosphate synthase/GTP cyclohydrolase II
MAAEGSGIFFYLRIDGRGAGLAAKVRATELEVGGMDTHASRIHIGVPPEGRNFSKVAQYLKENGYNRIRLLSNNPSKKEGLEAMGISVQIEPLFLESPNEHVAKLYRTKRDKFSHLIDI